MRFPMLVGIRGILLPLLRSRLFHFAVLGGAIFAAAPRPPNRHRIDVNGAALAALGRAEAGRGGGTLVDSQMQSEVRSRAIEDEIIYREALRLGLDAGDPIVRQRLIQKLLLLVEDLGGASRPASEAELRAFFNADPARYRLAPTFHFIHVFASRPQALPDPATLPNTGIPDAGESFPYARDVTLSREAIERVYGSGFAAAVTSIVVNGEYSAPIASSFGWHRVRLVERVAGRIPTFPEVRGGIALDHALARRQRIIGDWLKKTAAQYDIEVDGKPQQFAPTLRVAMRAEASAED